MELDITNLFENGPHRDYSASAAELGDCAGAITWRAALDDCRDWLPAFSLDEQETIRAWLAGFGAWDREELDATGCHELSALLLQFIAGDIREVPGMEPDAWDWDEYQQLAERGVISGRMYRGDGGRIYFYVGE